VKYSKYFGRTITNDASCTREIKCRIVMEKAAFNKEKTLVTDKLDITLTHWHTPPAVRQAEPTMPLLLILALCQ
jgi:hypothetical protein